MKLLLFIALTFLTGLRLSSQNPSLHVIDTDFSKGRLQLEQEVSLSDIAKFHGHSCDGLVVGFLGLREVLFELFPDSLVDRTDVRVVSKSSPCLTDVAVYLSGGRYQFNTFYVSDSFDYLMIAQRISTGNAYGFRLKKGVKPASIDSLGNLAIVGNLDACGLDLLRQLEDQFTVQLLQSMPFELFDINQIERFAWTPVLRNSFVKTDVLNKSKEQCR